MTTLLTTDGSGELLEPFNCACCLCARNSGSDSVGQPFRNDGPLGNNGRETSFLFHTSITSSSIAGNENSPSVRWRLVASAMCVCSCYAPHVGIISDVRVAFWRSLKPTRPLSQSSKRYMDAHGFVLHQFAGLNNTLVCRNIGCNDAPFLSPPRVQSQHFTLVF